MRISGSGISSPITVKVQRDFVPKTELALVWSQVSDGNYIAVDRGSSNDVYNTTIKVRGVESEINAILEGIEANRLASSNPGRLTLSDFASDELIFGCDVNHSGSIYAVVMDKGERLQTALRVWQITLKLRVWDTSLLTFVGSSGNTTLKNVSIGYSGSAVYTDSPIELYSNPVLFQDNRNDNGKVELTALIRIPDLRTLRRSMATGRGGGIILTSVGGVNFLFGPTRPVSYPLNVKVLNLTEEEPIGQYFKKVTMTIVEVI